MQSTDTKPDGVILLHGIFRTKLSMRRMEKFLQRQGYQTLNIGYKSTRYNIETIIDVVHPAIKEFSATVDKIHFIGFSMGGLVTRAYLHKYRPSNLGRVVMLGTPNKGSRIADLIKNLWLYRKLFGPAGQQLLTVQDMFQEIFGTVDYELGIIAGTTWDPLSNKLMGGPNDGTVSVESTKLEGMKDHAIIRSKHTFMATNKKAWGLTAGFLKTGRFD